MGEFEGKVAILFGAARGIGAAAVRAFHREGASVVIGDVLDAEGTALAAELGEARARYVHCDVAMPRRSRRRTWPLTPCSGAWTWC